MSIYFTEDQVSQVMVDPTTSEVVYVLHDYEDGTSTAAVSKHSFTLPIIAIATVMCIMLWMIWTVFTLSSFLDGVPLIIQSLFYNRNFEVGDGGCFQNSIARFIVVMATDLHNIIYWTQDVHTKFYTRTRNQCIADASLYFNLNYLLSLLDLPCLNKKYFVPLISFFLSVCTGKLICKLIQSPVVSSCCWHLKCTQKSILRMQF